jgi:hypothetical protein
MVSHWWKAGLVALGLLQGVTFTQAAPAPSETPEAQAADLAHRIDQRVEAGFASRKIKPVALADDAEFLRRVYLDLTGRIPPVSAVHKFLADTNPDKRRQLVEDLLASPNYVNHMTNVWRAILVPPSNNQQFQAFNPQMEGWLRKRLREDVAYDKVVRDLLTANTGFNGRQRGPVVQQTPDDFGAAPFYQSNEFKAENLAAASTRLFMGVKLECAQCHDHPFAKYTRKQFWETAVFFTGLQPQQFRQPNPNQPQQPALSPREIKIPGTEKVVQARFLDGKKPDWKDDSNPRELFAQWLTSTDNPYFARAAVNRLWGHFFGIGIVEPVDDFGDENLPSHPELLDDLARELVAHKYDMKFIIRAITASKTYQLTSAVPDATAVSEDEHRSFNRMALKGLTPEQLFDSLSQATGYRDNMNVNQGRRFNAFGTPRAEFLSRFANASEKRTEHQTSILQALALMNGTFIADVTSLDRSQTLAAIVDSPFLDTRQRLDTLFMAALSRKMREEEATRLVKYVEKGGPSGDARKALADVFWVLLNSSEFCLNH